MDEEWFLTDFSLLASPGGKNSVDLIGIESYFQPRTFCRYSFLHRKFDAVLLPSSSQDLEKLK